MPTAIWSPTRATDAVETDGMLRIAAIGSANEDVTESNAKNSNNVRGRAMYRAIISCAGSDGKGEPGASWAGPGSSFAEKKKRKRKKKQDKGDLTRRR